MYRSRPALLIAAAAATAALAAGCASAGTSPSPDGSPPSSAVSYPSTSATSVTATSVSVAPSTAGFEPGARRLTGSADNGSTWDVTVPQVTGGTTRTRQAFNQAMDRAANGITARARADRRTTVSDGELTPREVSRTVVAKTTLSGVLITLGATDGTAYPSHSVETTVLDPGKNQALTLDSLFTDPGAARRQLLVLAAAADTSGRLAQTESAPDALRAWIALDEGLHLYVPVIHALGDYVPVTIPWPRLAGLLNPAGQVLFSSP